jgi:hypothetical protein
MVFQWSRPLRNRTYAVAFEMLYLPSAERYFII